MYDALFARFWLSRSDVSNPVLLAKLHRSRESITPQDFLRIIVDPIVHSYRELIKGFCPPVRQNVTPVRHLPLLQDALAILEFPDFDIAGDYYQRVGTQICEEFGILEQDYLV